MAKSGIQNLQSFQKKLEKRIVIDNPERTLKKFSTADQLHLVEGTALNKALYKGGTGITYQKYNPRRQHTASAKQENHLHQILDFLVSNITSNVKRTRHSSQLDRSVASAPYAGYGLEFGTSTILKKDLSCSLHLERNRPKIKRIFKDGGYIRLMALGQFAIQSAIYSRLNNDSTLNK